MIYEKERNAGFLSPFGYSAATVAAAIDAVCSMEVLVFLVCFISGSCCNMFNRATFLVLFDIMAIPFFDGWK